MRSNRESGLTEDPKEGPSIKDIVSLNLETVSRAGDWQNKSLTTRSAEGAFQSVCWTEMFADRLPNFIEKFGGEIGFVWPGYGIYILMYGEVSEVRNILLRLEDRPIQIRLKYRQVSPHPSRIGL